MSSFHGVNGADNNSHSTTPYEYTSAFSSKFSALNISGAIHSNVPWMFERPDSSVLRRTRDRPKSAIFTRHLSSTRMLGDLRSRWRIGGDRECRYCMPLATDSATWCVRGPPSGPPFLRRMLCRDPRRMNSVAMKGGSAHHPMNSSKFGCLSRDSTTASSLKRVTTSAPRSSSCFTATIVPFHVPRNTSAKPPTATRSCSCTSDGAISHSRIVFSIGTSPPATNALWFCS